jgi:signal transduction histidine kinase
MEERVHHLGGTLRVKSRDGSGTTIAAVLPLAS